LGTAQTEQTLEKAARNWQDGKTKRQHWKHTKSSLSFYSVIFVHKLDIIRKKCVIWLQIFSATEACILPISLFSCMTARCGWVLYMVCVCQT